MEKNEMKPDKRIYKLEQVSITSTYDTIYGYPCYVVTELWRPRKFADFSEDWEYKYKTRTFERANEIAKNRVEKYGK